MKTLAKVLFILVMSMLAYKAHAAGSVSAGKVRNLQVHPGVIHDQGGSDATQTWIGVTLSGKGQNWCDGNNWYSIRSNGEVGKEFFSATLDALQAAYQMRRVVRIVGTGDCDPMGGEAILLLSVH